MIRIEFLKFVVPAGNGLYRHISVVAHLRKTYGHLSLAPLVALSKEQHEAREKYGRAVRAFAKVHASRQDIQAFRDQNRTPAATMAPSVWKRIAWDNGWDDISQKTVADLFEARAKLKYKLCIESHSHYLRMFLALLASSSYGAKDELLRLRPK